MKKTELEIVREQNEIMANALRDLIDYHHHIGNSDRTYTNNQIHTTLYKLATNGLNDANNVSIEKTEPLIMFTSEQLLADIKSICDDYNATIINNHKKI